MPRKYTLSAFLPIVLGLALCGVRPANAGTFTDGFEGSFINPFWTVVGPGSATLVTSTTHSGSQSAQLSASSSFPWGAFLVHDFSSEQTGSVSVWIQGQSLCCNSGAEMGVGTGPAVDHLYAGFLQSGNINDTTHIAARLQTSAYIETDFHTTAADWHHYEIDAGASGVTLMFDGSTVYTNSSLTSFNHIELGTYGGPGGTGFFDDFRATTRPAGAAPEPATGFLMAGVVAGICLLRRVKVRRGMLAIAALAAVAAAAPARAGTLAVEITNSYRTFSSGTEIGWEFNLASNVAVTALGYFDINEHGLVNSHEIGLYGPSGSLLASTTVLPSDPETGGFAFHSIDPVFLTAALDYRIAALPTSVDGWAWDIVSIIQTSSSVSYVQPRRVPGSASTLSYPTGIEDVAFAFFGPNFEFDLASPVPEPSSLAFALTGCCLLFAFRRNRKHAPC